jgi:hypothetical protein
MSFAPQVTTGSDPKFYGNALRFATREEAEASAFDLSMRWTAVRDWRVVESDDPVNYAIRDGLLVSIEGKEL